MASESSFLPLKKVAYYPGERSNEIRIESINNFLFQHLPFTADGAYRSGFAELRTSQLEAERLWTGKHQL